MNEENEYCIRVKGTNMVVIGFVDVKPSNYIAEPYNSNYIQGFKCYKVKDILWKVDKDYIIEKSSKRAIIKNNVFTDGIDFTSNGDIKSNVKFVNADWELVKIKTMEVYNGEN